MDGIRSGQTPTLHSTDDTPRDFPCEACGADLTFNIRTQTLRCQHCGWQKELTIAPNSRVEEQDFAARIRSIGKNRRRTAVPSTEGVMEVNCQSCGGAVQFIGPLTSDFCGYCGASLHRDHVRAAEQRIPVDGLLPFFVERKQAQTELAKWVRSRWFAPNDFLRRGIDGAFQGMYMPYWTFDAHTANTFVGERGDHYYVTVGTGKNRRRVRRTRWRTVSGQFSGFFDDMLVVAVDRLPRWLITKLEPWPLRSCLPYTADAMAGFYAMTYEIDLPDGFAIARTEMEESIRQEVRHRIGGDEQRIHDIQTQYSAITYKHLLLPLWLLTYSYQNKPYRVAVNAQTGEVQGERPWSWWKIAIAVVLCAVVLGVAAFGFAAMQSG